MCHLSHDDIWLENNIWVMRFPMTKDGFARTVPIHEHLVADGLLDYWRAASPGYMFVNRSPAKVGPRGHRKRCARARSRAGSRTTFRWPTA